MARRFTTIKIKLYLSLEELKGGKGGGGGATRKILTLLFSTDIVFITSVLVKARISN